MSRPSWDEYFLGIADAVAARADCTRRAVGAVIVKGNRIVSTGYNGAPAGSQGCLEGACPRGRHYPVEEEGVLVHLCGCGGIWPCPEYARPMTAYDNCISVHAEANALLYADRDKCEGAVMYLTCEPCNDCKKLISASGIANVIYHG